MLFRKGYLEKDGETQGEKVINGSQVSLNIPCFLSLTWEICNVCWSWLVPALVKVQVFCELVVLTLAA